MELIELVRQRKILYDTKCKEYKDHLIRNAAWEEIAEILNEPVTKCKDDWTKLRNAFASALKRRRNKKSGQAAGAFVPWKHEEDMGFLIPYMEGRNTKTNVMPPPESPPTDDSFDESLSETPSTTRSQNPKPKLQDVYELLKSSNDLRRQKQNVRQDMDETDLFFLSMSKEVKTLSKLEQTKIKLDLHTAISQAVIRQIEQNQTSTVIQTPPDNHTFNHQHTSTNIHQPIAQAQSSTYIQSPKYVKLSSFPTIKKPVIRQLKPNQSSTVIQTPPNVQSPTYFQPITQAQSSTYIHSPKYVKLSSFPTIKKPVIRQLKQNQSSTVIQTHADDQSPTYMQPTTHTQSPTSIQSSSFPSTSRSQKSDVVSDDLKAYYDSINFDDC